jgi:hypothetical protein
VLDLDDLRRQWYDWTIKDGARPDFLKDRASYYLLGPGNSGANGEWKHETDFDKLVAITTNYTSMRVRAGDMMSFIPRRSVRSSPLPGPTNTFMIRLICMGRN